MRKFNITTQPYFVIPKKNLTLTTTDGSMREMEAGELVIAFRYDERHEDSGIGMLYNYDLFIFSFKNLDSLFEIGNKAKNEEFMEEIVHYNKRHTDFVIQLP